MTAGSGTLAGIVAYQPDGAELARLVTRIAPDVVAVVVFANSPIAPEEEARLREAASPAVLEVVRPGANVGLGAAYDAFVARAAALGAAYALILDQDSLPGARMVPRLVAVHAALRVAGEHPALVGPRPVGPDGVKLRIPVRQPPRSVASAVQVEFAISSGSLVDVAAAEAVGDFRGDFFIDAIDLEWCMRANARGFSVWSAEDIAMDHRLGRGIINVSGLRLADQPPRRLYTYIRNQLAMMRLAHVPTGHKLKVAVSLPARIVIYLVRNGFSRDCAAALVNGLRDGLAGRLGPPDRALDPPWRRGER